MGWAIVSVLGFLVVTALVICLARSNTARWEARHRAAQAAIRAREEASLRARAGALLAQRAPEGHRHLPHLHLPHVHLPPAIVARLPRPHVHVPRLHVPRLHLPTRDGRLPRRRPDRQADAAPSVDTHEVPAAPPVDPHETPTGSPS
jgi:hypothetical protein